jgi:arginyl-tRNA synthetase
MTLHIILINILEGSDHLIDILGADHGGYVKRMSAAVAALSDNKAKFTA